MSQTLGSSVFADPWNPSSTEVRAWAYTPAAVAPCEDWDLSLAWARHERDYLEFAADPECPNRDYFLHLLYFIVGNAVRNGYRTVPEPVVRGFIDLAANSQSKQVQLWYRQALVLLKHPSEFEYAAWCGGGLAQQRT
jgi:hypothetical protein